MSDDDKINVSSTNEADDAIEELNNDGFERFIEEIQKNPDISVDIDGVNRASEKVLLEKIEKDYDEGHTEQDYESMFLVDDTFPDKIRELYGKDRYQEADYLLEFLDYLLEEVYKGHYHADKIVNVTAFDLIISGGFAKEFCAANIIKYADRLGKKDDPRKELYKIIHYAIMALYAIDINLGMKNDEIERENT